MYHLKDQSFKALQAKSFKLWDHENYKWFYQAGPWAVSEGENDTVKYELVVPDDLKFDMSTAVKEEYPGYDFYHPAKLPDFGIWYKGRTPKPVFTFTTASGVQIGLSPAYMEPEKFVLPPAKPKAGQFLSEYGKMAYNLKVSNPKGPWTDDQKIDLAILAIFTHYRMTRELINAYGLLSREDIDYIFDIAVGEVIDEKKT